MPRLPTLTTALTLTLAACGTAGPASAPAPAAPDPVSAPTPAPAPSLPPLAPPPWLFAPWSDVLVASTTVPDALLRVALPPLPDPDLGVRARRPIPDAALPAELRAWIGRELTVLDHEANAPCTVRITGFEAIASVDPELDDMSLLYPDDEDASEIPQEIRAQRLWDLGDKVLAARYEPPDACQHPLLAGLAGGAPDMLTSRPATASEHKSALAVIRRHALWSELDAAYHAASRFARANARRLADAGHSSGIPSKVPAHWDIPLDREDAGPEVLAWIDPRGDTRYLLATLGNALACDAPRTWFLVDPQTATVLRYGLRAWPTRVLDLEHDGAWELVRESATDVWIERVDPAGADEPEVVRRASTRADDGLQCGWDQVPPIARMREAIARPTP